jgi:transposase-like protein
MAAKRKSVAELAREHGIPAQTVYNRTSRGWKLKKALTTPVANTGRRAANKPTGGLPEASNDAQWYEQSIQRDVRPVIFSILGAIGVILLAVLMDM